MTRENKNLLLKDLCARLPYGVICQLSNNNGDVSITEKLELGGLEHFISGTMDVKPYLRPLSSMTEEEGKELEHLFCEIDAPCWVDTEYGCVNFAGGNDFIDTEIAEVYTDWLNKKMFDYRGLIEKGLALEAKEDMYK